MMRSIPIFVFCVSVVFINGCSSSPGDKLMKEMIVAINELADAIEKKLPEATVNAIQTRVEDLSKKLDGLKLSDKDQKELADNYGDAIYKAAVRLQKARTGESGTLGNMIPGLPKAGK